MNDTSHPAQIGRYQIQRLIGAGGMGDVYLARDPNIDRRLAIKTVRLRGAPAEVDDHKRRLLREAKAAGRLVHANVVTLFDAGEADGVLYLAFEFVDGPDLGRRMKSPPPLTLRHSLMLVRQIAEGLESAHQQGIIHRDIKPSNILIDPRGQAKIADFGLAKMNDESIELTRSGSVVGSPQYMSPEQVRGDALDGRTDIFSLGVLLFELMSSMRPFGGQTISTLVFEILSKEPPPLAQLRPDLPPAIAELVRHMLAKDLNSRVADAGQIVARLDQVLKTTPAAMLDAAAVTPIDANAPTELMPQTPAPSPAASPSFASGSVSATLITPSSTPAPSMVPPPPPPMAPAMVPPTPTQPLTSPGPVTAESPGSQHAVAEMPGASGPQPAAPSPGSSGGKKMLWVLGLLGGAVLLCMAVGVWWLAGWLGGKGSPDTPPDVAAQVNVAAAEGTAASPDGRDSEDSAAEDSGTGTPTTSEPGAGSVDDRVTDGGTSGRDADTGTAGTSTAGAPEPAAVDRQPSAAAAGTRTPPRDPSPTVESAATTTRPSSPPSSPPASTSAPTAPPSPSVQPPAATSSAPPRDAPPPDAPGVAAHVVEFDAAAAKAQREMTTGRFFKFMIEPGDAVVRSWRRGDERQTVLGQAQNYPAKKKDGRSVELPTDGDYLLTFIAEGHPNYTVLVHASSGGGPGPQVIRASLSSPGGGRQGPSRLRVSRSLSFDGTPANARVWVDGVDQGPASQWPGGGRAAGPRHLQLTAGQHRVRLEAQGYEPYEVLVDVSPGGRRSATVRFDLRRSN